MNLKKVDGIMETAAALQARDYKGFGTGFQMQNAVTQSAQTEEEAQKGTHGI